MIMEFLPEAEQEFREAAQYYEKVAPGIGMTFITKVHTAISFIKQNPFASEEIDSGIRKKVISRFPYNILYSIEAGIIIIIAIAHQKRRPGFWQSRLK